MSRARLNRDEQSFLLSSSRLVISRCGPRRERADAFNNNKAVSIDTYCALVRRYTHIHTRRPWWSRLALRNLIVRSVISETGSLAALHNVIISHASQFSSYLPTPRQCLLTEIDVHLSSRLPHICQT